MTDTGTRYPLSGTAVRTIAVYFQAQNAAAAGYHVISGMGVTRLSATSVTVAAGYYTAGTGIVTSYAGGTVTSIVAPADNNHRYDLIYFDTVSLTAKVAAGVAADPADHSLFLENASPQPPDLPLVTDILLAVICVAHQDSPAEEGIRSTNNGSPVYSTAGVADMRIFGVRGPNMVSSLTAADAQGDILYRGAASWARLPAGTAYQVLRTSGAGSNPVWDNVSIANLNTTSPTQAQGDIIFRGASAWQRLAAGTANKFLMSNGVADPSWNSLKLEYFYPTAITQGSIAMRGASIWEALSPGTEGQVLTAHGTGDLTWATPSVSSFPHFRNYAWNSSFTYTVATSDLLGWTKIGANATIAQTTGTRDGYGSDSCISVTSGGAGHEGVKQTLKDLKASTVYTVSILAYATSGDTARIWTSGAGSNLNLTSTTVAWTAKTGTFTTNATPDDVVIMLGSNTSTDIVYFDQLMITEGTTVPTKYWKDKEWDAPGQLLFGKGDGSSVVSTGQLYQYIQAQDNYEIVGWQIYSDLSTTANFDVWKKSSFPPANADSLGVTKPFVTASTTNSDQPDWTITEITKGDWIDVEIEANNNSKSLSLCLLVRRR